MSTGNPRLDSALLYAKRGWPIIPLHDVATGVCTCLRSEACATPGKHPLWTGWQDKASTSGADLYAWWEDRPTANVGFVTNRASGVWVLDIDIHKGGSDSLTALVSEHGALPDTLIHATGSGGMHLLFQWPATGEIPTTSGALGAGIDTRGRRNGMAILPGSVSLNGGYTVLKEHPVAVAPDWLLNLLLPIAAKQDHVIELPTAPAEPYDEAKVAPRLRELVSEIIPADEGRFRHFMAIVGEARRLGFTQGQTTSLITPWCRTVDKYADRIGDEVARVWGKLESEDAALRLEVTSTTPSATPPQPTGTAPEPQPAPAKTLLTIAEPATYSLTDDGNALRYVDTYRNHVRYCVDRGQWLAWDGYRWRYDDGTVTEYARSLARALPDSDKTEIRHKRYTLSQRGVTNMLSLARSAEGTRVRVEDMDARPYELNTPAGVVNLRTATLAKPDPSALHSRSTPVAPDFDATPTRWLAFLAETFAGEPEVTTYVQRLLGLSLIGSVIEPVLPFCHGSGANGKSTLLDVAQAILGIGDDGYARPAPADLLLANAHGPGHPTELANLAGARLVVASELEAGQRFAEARIKQLTGKDTISARFMRQDFFSFRPTHTIWLLANDQPAVRVGGPAFWRRLRLVPFLNVVPPEHRIGDLSEQLIDAEGPAILAWCVRGAADYLAHGLGEPASVKVATEGYAHDQDTVAQFLEERCEIGDPNAMHLRVHVSTFRAAYESWCHATGETALSAKALTQTLTGRYGITRDRDNRARYYAGVRLTDVSSEADEPSQSPESNGPDNEWWQR